MYMQTSDALSMFMLTFIFVRVCGLFELKRISEGFFVSFISVLSLEVKLSEGKGHIHRYNSTSVLSMSRAMTWIFNAICRGLLRIQ